MSASDYLETELRKHIFRTGTFAKPANLWLALTTVAVLDSDTGSLIAEPSGGSYARYDLGPPLDATWTGSSSTTGITTNANDISFPLATGNWGDIVGWAITTSSSAGSIIVKGSWTATKTINTGDTFFIPAGNLVVTIS